MMKLRHLAVIAWLFIFAGSVLPATAATIRITVNNTQITDTQISLRAGLLRLEGRGSSNGARNQLARDELIDEALQMQEAERLGITVTRSQVDDALLNVARGIKISPDKLAGVLSSNGVNISTLRERLKASIAWQGVTQVAIRHRVQISDVEIEAQAAEQLEETLSFDFILKEILFIIPRGSKISSSRRSAEANQYRKSFQGCASAIELSLSYTDAAVIDVGRRHATQMPDALAKELAALEVGGITKPRVVGNGVSMLAICSKTSARDLTFIKDNLVREEGSEKLKEESTEYLERLKERANITIR